MKKRIFLLIAMIAVVVCLFAISSSAAEYYTEWGETEAIEDIGVTVNDVLANVKSDSQNARVKLSCNCEKGSHTYPTYYIMSINVHLRDLFNRNYEAINAKNPCGATYSNNSIIAVEVPEGIASTYYNSGRSATFSAHALLEYVKLPSTMTTICKYAFADNPNLKYVEFNENSNIKTLGDSAFNGSAELIGVCLPDSITAFEAACFIGCHNLGPVHLPENLKNIGTTTQWNTFQGGENGNGAKPTKLFFTNEKFTNPLEVEKPKVYYMPSQLNYMDNGIRGMSNINDVVVFPETFTTVSGGYVFCGLGGTEEKSKTIVFLGDMTSIPFVQDTSISYVDFYFMNKNDSLSQGANFHGFARQFGSGEIGGTYIYSCTDGKALSLVNTFYGQANWSTDLFKHLVDDRKTLKASADCVNNEKETTYCFCGELIGTNENENTALGHDNDVNNGAQLVGISYTVDGKTDYTSNGYKIIKCARCSEDNNKTVANPLIDCIGYSTKEKDSGSICIGYSIDEQAMSEYMIYNSSFTYGVVGYIPENSENPLKVENGKIQPIDPKYTIFAEVGNAEVCCKSFDFIIKGFCENENISIVMGAYLFDGENAYYLCIDAETGNVNQTVDAKAISFAKLDALVKSKQ